MLRGILLTAVVLGLFGAWYFVLPTGKPVRNYPVQGGSRISVSDGVWVKVYTKQN